MKILDLGCGTRKYKPKPNSRDIVIGVDINKNSLADIIHDLDNFPYPLEDNEFDLVYASHILESIENPEEFLKEVYRVLNKNGRVIIKVPHFSSATAIGFLEHKHYFNLAAFTDLPFGNYFKLKKIRLNYCVYREKWYRKVVNGVLSFFANINVRFCERLWCYWVGGFSEIEAEMMKKL